MHRNNSFARRAISSLIALGFLFSDPTLRLAAADSSQSTHEVSSQTLAPSSPFKRDEEVIPGDEAFMKKRGQDVRLGKPLRFALVQLRKSWDDLGWDGEKLNDIRLNALVNRFNSGFENDRLHGTKRKGIHNDILMYKGYQRVEYKGRFTPYLLLSYGRYGSSQIDRVFIPLPLSAFDGNEYEYEAYLKWLGIESKAQRAAFDKLQIWPTEAMPEASYAVVQGSELLKEIARPFAPNETKREIYADDVAISEVINAIFRAEDGVILHDPKQHEKLSRARLQAVEGADDALNPIAAYEDAALLERIKYARELALDIFEKNAQKKGLVGYGMHRALIEATLVLTPGNHIGGMLSHASKRFGSRIILPLGLVKSAKIEDIAQEIFEQGYHLARGDWNHQDFQHDTSTHARLTALTGLDPRIQVIQVAQTGKIPSGGYTDTRKHASAIHDAWVDQLHDQADAGQLSPEAALRFAEKMSHTDAVILVGKTVSGRMRVVRNEITSGNNEEAKRILSDAEAGRLDQNGASVRMARVGMTGHQQQLIQDIIRLKARGVLDVKQALIEEAIDQLNNPQNPTGGNIGEGKLPIEVVRAWMDRELRKGVFVMAGTSPMLWTLEGDKMVKRPATPKEQEPYRKLINNFVASEMELVKALNKLPATVDKGKILRGAQQHPVPFFPGMWTIAGEIAEHASSRFDARVYMGQLLAEALTPAQLAQVRVEGEWHLAVGDYEHKVVSHDPELLAAIQAILAQHKDAVAAELSDAREIQAGLFPTLAGAVVPSGGNMAIDLTQYAEIAAQRLIGTLGLNLFMAAIVVWDDQEMTVEAAKKRLAELQPETMLRYAIGRDDRKNKPVVTIISRTPSLLPGVQMPEPRGIQRPLDATGVMRDVTGTTKGKIDLGREREAAVGEPLDVIDIRVEAGKAQPLSKGKIATTRLSNIPAIRNDEKGIPVIRTGEQLQREMRRPLAAGETERTIYVDDTAISELLRDKLRAGAVRFDQSNKSLHYVKLRATESGEEKLEDSERYHELNLKLRAEFAIQKAQAIIDGWQDAALRADAAKALAGAQIIFVEGNHIGGMFSHAGKRFANRIYMPLGLMRHAQTADLGDEIAGQAYHLARGDWQHEHYQHRTDVFERLKVLTGPGPYIDVVQVAQTEKLPLAGYTAGSVSTTGAVAQAEALNTQIATELAVLPDAGAVHDLSAAMNNALSRSAASVIVINIDDPNHHVNLYRALQQNADKGEDGTRIVLLAQRDIKGKDKDGSELVRPAKEVLAILAQTLGLQAGKHFHALLTVEELQGPDKSTAATEQSLTNYIAAQFGDWAAKKGQTISAKNIATVDSATTPIALATPAGILHVVTAAPAADQVTDMHKVMGFTELALRLRQSGHENISFDELVKLIGPAQQAELTASLKALGVTDTAKASGVMEFLVKPMPVSAPPSLTEKVNGLKSVIAAA